MPDIFPENFEQKTGFDKIRIMLKSRCISTLGEDMTDDLRFLTEFDSVTILLGETEEFIRIIKEFQNFPATHFFDMRTALSRIRVEGRYLDENELFELKLSLESVKAIVDFFKKQDQQVFPLLKKKAAQVQVFPYIYDRIDRIINKFGKIRDNATPELAIIRKEIQEKQAGISKKLHLILKSAQKEGIVEEDATVAIRDGRAVIPVSASQKRKLKGIVYDESATGKTSYIEPAEIVELNNELRELENAERREIIRILTNFSNDIRPYLPELLNSYSFLGEIDFIRAKALLSNEFNALKPELSDHPCLDWKQAIHPLLKQALKKENRKIVPLDIRLSQAKHILLISGPNAGGKSVCLKTAGLLQYMLQCGLPVPVAEGSKAGIFNGIFIDIGDEQSIENDLSTYSSHLLNMKYFLRNSNDKTLVLIDEFGTGTEPMLGGAIAESILEKLIANKTYGVITTHYTNLKHFAASSEGIENGAMLYDSQKMEPLFILETGKPGSSFAFEIARKIGLPEEILSSATEKVGKKHVDFDKTLRTIARDKRYWETKREKIRKVEKILDEQAEKYEKDLKEVKQLRKEILEKAKEEAGQLLAGVNKKIENTISEIRQVQAERERTKELRNNLDALKKEVSAENSIHEDRLNQKIEKLKEAEKKRNLHRPVEEKKQEKVISEAPSSELKPGDKVKITGKETIGEVIEINTKNVVVAFGQLITTLPVNQVERISNHEAKKLQKPENRYRTNIANDLMQRKLTFKPEIDIRGQRMEEAIANIQAFIDEAIMIGVSNLRILHGKGYGILKESIRSYLKSEPLVSEFHDEHVQFGGAGITIVKLDV